MILSLNNLFSASILKIHFAILFSIIIVNSNAQQKLELHKINSKKIRVINVDRIDSIKTMDNKNWKSRYLSISGDSINLYSSFIADTLQKERYRLLTIQELRSRKINDSSDSMLVRRYTEYVYRDTLLHLPISSIKQLSISRVKNRERAIHNFSGLGFTIFFVGFTSPLGAVISFLDKEVETGMIMSGIAVGTWLFVLIQQHRLSNKKIDLLEYHLKVSDKTD